MPVGAGRPGRKITWPRSGSATVPLAELFGYATRLRGRTQDRGAFTARPTGYAPAPAALVAGK
ncbi:hypothetical protein ACVNF4_29060 [Streptomyces sp. S6]